MYTLEKSFEEMRIGSRKRNRSERYEYEYSSVNEINNLLKTIKIANGSEDEMGDDEQEMGDDDDDSIIRNEEYKYLINSWNMENEENMYCAEDINYPDREKEMYGYETLYDGFYNSEDELFDYCRSDNDFNDNE